MKRIIFTACLYIFLAQPAFAATEYISARLLASPSKIELSGFKMKNVRAYPQQNLSMDAGKRFTAAGFSIACGVDFNWAGNLPLRLEGEASFRKGGTLKSLDEYATSGPIRTIKIKTELEVDFIASAMLNLWFDIPVGGFPVKPYLGGGLGYDVISYEIEATTNPTWPTISTIDSKSGRDITFQYQLGAGAYMNVNERTFIDLGVRYMDKSDWTAETEAFHVDFSTQALDIGLSLRYYF